MGAALTIGVSLVGVVTASPTTNKLMAIQLPKAYPFLFDLHFQFFLQYQ